MDVEITTATLADTDTVFELVRALARYERLEHEVVATPADLGRLLFGHDAVGEAVIARYHGEAVGLAVFFPNLSTFSGKAGLFLEDLFVKPEFRRHGIGRALLRHVAGLARKRGYARLEWIALDWNQPALDFYAGIGAQVRTGWVVLRLNAPALETFSTHA